MDPLIQDTLLDLWMHILGIILGGGVVTAVVWWFRHRGTNHRNPLFAEAVLREMTLERVSRVIDIGCGTGWASREVARIAADGDVVGIDISERVVRKAQGLISQDELHDDTNLAYVTANAESIPYLSGYFDYATCIVSFSWFSYPEAALIEMERVLKSSGKLYIADVCKDHLVSRVVTTLCNCTSPYKENLYSAEEYRELFEDRFVDVYQRKLSPLGGLLTVGTKGEAIGGCEV